MAEFIGVPSLIQGRYGRRGNFELVVARAEGGLAHYWRDNDHRSLPWHGPTPFADDLGVVESVCLIQSTPGDPGQLEVVANVGGQLAHLWRNAQPPFQWHGPDSFASGTLDPPGFIQSRYGRTGNFEVVTKTVAAGPSLSHYWRDPASVTTGVTTTTPCSLGIPRRRLLSRFPSSAGACRSSRATTARLGGWRW